MGSGSVRGRLFLGIPLAVKIGVVVLVGGIVIGYLVRQQYAESRRELAVKNAQENFRQRWADGDAVLLLELQGDPEEMASMKVAVRLTDSHAKEIEAYIREAQRRFQRIYAKSEALLQGENLSPAEQKDRIAQAIRYSELQLAIERDLRASVMACLNPSQRDDFVAWLEQSWIDSTLANWSVR